MSTITPIQSFTRPPARYTEASLVKELERLGIGRPSTYAAIMNKIQSRDYTVKEHHSLKPTEVGRIICHMMEENFAPIMDVTFTAKMEDQLEQIAEHEKDWKALIREFWSSFRLLVERAEKEATVPKLSTQLDCPKCGQKLQKIWARRGYFYGCSQYPLCDFTAPIQALEFKKEDYDPSFNWDSPCPLCGTNMTVRHGRFGLFLGCSRYPECHGILNVPKKGEASYAPETLPNCPAVGCDGGIVARKSRFGKLFFSCSNYPRCDVVGSRLEDLPQKYAGHPQTPAVQKGRFAKQAKKKQNKKSVARSRAPKKTSSRRLPSSRLSPELAAVVGAEELSRPQVIQKIWAYIKAHQLQDPQNRRLIRPDDKLAALFGSHEPVEMLRIAGLLKGHFLPANPA